MIRNKLSDHLNSRLPAYINGTLNPFHRKIVAFWLQRDKQAQITAENLQTLQTAVRSQPRRTPPPAVFSRIQAKIHEQQSTSNKISHPLPHPLSVQHPALGLPVLILSVVTLILAAVVMWQTLPPGIVLEWSVQGRAPEAFHVYRAELDAGETALNNQFELIEEVPASELERKYTFTDIRLLPGQNYVYRVDGLNAAGQPAASQTITGKAVDALPGQLAILLVLIFAAYCFWNMLRLYRPQKVSPI